MNEIIIVLRFIFIYIYLRGLKKYSNIFSAEHKDFFLAEMSF